MTGVDEVIYASCAASFAALIALMLARGRVSGPGVAIAAACAVTALWAADLAMPGLLPAAAGAVLNNLRLSAWLILTVALVGLQDARRGRSTLLPLLLAIGFCAVVVGFDLALLIGDRPAAGASTRLGEFLHAGFGVGGLLATENLLRNAGEEGRQRVWPLCLALGAIFAFELFWFADRLMVPGAGTMIAAGRGLVGTFAVPLLALAMARNRAWRVDIHVSRTVVLHTAALVAIGVFFLVLSTLGFLVRELGGKWGPALELITLFGSAIVLAAIFASRDPRVFLKHLIARHFFSHRYDYRAEWLRFVDTVSQPGNGADVLSLRVVRALAQIVDSPAGTLWCRRQESGYIAEIGWNQSPDRGRKLANHDPFLAGFRGGTWIQERPAAAGEAWPFDPARTWLAIPLPHGSDIIAFVMLAPPSHGYSLDIESFDLLRAAGRQAASYLAEERSTSALLDTRLLNEYSKRFAFVVHDIKNMTSQLGLVVANARRYIEDREFRQDMLLTLEDSVARMNRLLAQLHAGGRDGPGPTVEPDIVIANLAKELSTTGTPIELRLDAHQCATAVDGDRLRSVLSHLIDNAREAARAGSAVIVSSRGSADKITIDVVDAGPGMDEEFVRDELFRPFRTTKTGGLGIGAYQTRELLRMSGGDLEVISQKGAGTIMRVTLPMQPERHLAPSAA